MRPAKCVKMRGDQLVRRAVVWNRRTSTRKVPATNAALRSNAVACQTCGHIDLYLESRARGSTSSCHPTAAVRIAGVGALHFAPSKHRRLLLCPHLHFGGVGQEHVRRGRWRQRLWDIVT